MRVRHWLLRGVLLALVLGAVRELPLIGAEARLATTAKESELRLKRDITYLASDECEGRGPTTEGLKRAGEYIAAEFKRAGLKPGAADGTYFQPFTIAGAQLEAAPTLSLQGPLGRTIELKPGTHFEAMGLSKPGKVSGSVVFAGFGVANEGAKYDDFDKLDVKGKIVLVFNDLPRGDARFLGRANRGSWLQSMLSAKAALAASKGAVALLFVHTRDVAKDGDDLFNFGFSALSRQPAEIPVFQIKRSVAETLLGGADELNKLEADINGDFKPRSKELSDWTAHAELKLKRDKVPLRNVIAVLEGDGPLAKETVVIGAHYDHLGYGGAGGSLAPRSKKMAIHHGADDNGSGSTTVMELARRFGAIPKRQGRRLVFMTYSGEELGLFGSVHYCKEPTFPLKETVAMVNLDMVGRGPIDKTTGKSSVQVHGLDTAKEFDKLFNEVSKTSELTFQKIPTPSSRVFMASDHFSFYEKGVPVIFFFTGDHPDYHRPSDTSDKINVTGMRQVADLSEELIARLATDKERPTYVKQTIGGGRRGGVRLDISLSADEKEGLKIETISADGAGAKAGLKVGDFILEAAGKPVKTQSALVATVQSLRPGDTLELVIQRTGKKQTIKVEFPYVALLGLRPDYKEGIEGVSIVSVSANGPAAKGGLKAGDVIIEIAGKKVKDLEGYSEALKGHKSGATIDVTVLRDGKKQLVKVVLE